jgi:hypothetical protein
VRSFLEKRKTHSFQIFRQPTIRLLSRRSSAGRGFGPLLFGMPPSCVRTEAKSNKHLLGFLIIPWTDSQPRGNSGSAKGDRAGTYSNREASRVRRFGTPYSEPINAARRSEETPVELTPRSAHCLQSVMPRRTIFRQITRDTFQRAEIFRLPEPRDAGINTLRTGQIRAYQITLAMMLLVLSGCGDAHRTSDPVPSPTPPKTPAAEVAAPAVPSPFSSPGGGFRVALPVIPRRTEEWADLPEGGKVKATAFTTQDAVSKVVFVVGYTEFPKEAIAAIENKDEALDNSAAGLVAPYKGEIKQKEALMLGKAPGRALTFDVPANGRQGAKQGIGQVFLVGDRLYNLSVIAPAESFPTEQG